MKGCLMHFLYGLSLGEEHCCLSAVSTPLFTQPSAAPLSAWQEKIARPPHNTSNKRAVLIRAFPSLALYHPLDRSFTLLITVFLHEALELIVLGSIERIPQLTNWGTS
ncbi:hypothetical protein ILYODFUR_006054 [Ilyodon furcidens]|uniref:Secreted protein n=1 Tax=Ilyodon furcidens TaxID=33524 RepID=A0ABV0TSD4_9TELE